MISSIIPNNNIIQAIGFGVIVIFVIHKYSDNLGGIKA